jgi:dipeptidyl aminopeptidase/acylaminoacyl peptidase
MVTPDAAPTLAIQGTKDRYVNYEQSVWIIDRLLQAGVPAELETIEGSDHGFKGADSTRAEQRMIGFFDRFLRPAAGGVTSR